MNEAYQQHEIGQIDRLTYFESLRGSLATDLSDNDFLDGWLAVHIGTIDGIDNLLTLAAASWPLYGFTNSNKTHHDVTVVKFADTLRHFNHVFESSAIGLRKPDRGAFEYVAAEIDVDLARILFVDDSVENVESAQACGMPAVLVRSIESVRSALRLNEDQPPRGSTPSQG